MHTTDYDCPVFMSERFAEIFKDRKDIRILNFGAGTGLQGIEVGHVITRTDRWVT